MLFIFNNLNILFLTMTLFSSIFSISATNWFSCWMGLEFNMLSFIPLLTSNNNLISNESALKYFTVQAAASSMFLFSSNIQSIQNSLSWNFNMSFLINLIMVSSLFIKLGAAPFHSWFISVLQGLSWFKSLILLTWQKLAPLFLMSYIHFYNVMILGMAILSSIVGSLGGLTQTSLKKIMAFSSINHMAWFISILNLNNYILKYYFFIYTLMTTMCILLFKVNNMSKLSQPFSSTQNICLSISLFSLGGLPPLLGFLPKWMVIQNLILNNLFMIVFILVLTALITLFFYLQITLNILALNFVKQKWNYWPNKPNLFMLYLYSFTTLGLIFINMLA